MSKTQVFAAVAALGLVAACAQQEEPVPVTPEPIFDKFGNVSGGTCEVGYIYVVGAERIPVCIPEDECQEYVTVNGALLECPPPDRQRDDRDDDDARGQTPGAQGSATAGGGSNRN